MVLSAAQAQTLTARIKKAGEEFGALLLEAYEGEAWRPMGYTTWQDYVAGEFTFTREHSYRLLTQSAVERAVGEPVTRREAQAVRGAVLPMGNMRAFSQAPSEAVKAALAEQRLAVAELAEAKKQAKESDAFWAEIAASVPADFDPKEDSERIDRTHRLFRALDAFTSLPEPSELLADIPDYQFYRMAAVPAALAWLTRFAAAWEARE